MLLEVNFLIGFLAFTFLWVLFLKPQQVRLGFLRHLGVLLDVVLKHLLVVAYGVKIVGFKDFHH